MSSRDTKMIFKNLENLKTSHNLPSVMIKVGSSTTTSQEKFGLLVKCFYSAYSPQTNVDVQDLNKSSTSTYLEGFRNEIAEILLYLSKSKSNGPNGSPHIVLQKNASQAIK